MSRPVRACVLGMLFLLLATLSRPARAVQESPSSSNPPPKQQPAAKSPEEFEAFQKFIREPNPEEQLRLVEDFLLQYPDSALKEFAYQTATQDYQVKNDYARLRTYGELTLAENKDNLVALLLLASAIPEKTDPGDLDAEEDLSDAEDYAKRALEALEKLPPRVELPAEQWERTKKEAASGAHAALGMIALVRKDFAQAESAFRQAVELATQPDAILLYRLGLCYSFEKKFAPALEAFDRAEKYGGVRITTPEGASRDLVAEAREFVLKAKDDGGTASPAETAPVAETAPAAPEGSGTKE